MADSLFSKTIEEASEACDLDLLKIMKSEHGELKQTIYVQPALVAVSVGIYRMLQRDLPKLAIAGMVGLSLGEYSALMASDAVDFQAGMALLADRARFMQADADKEPSTMAAILNPDVAGVERLLAKLRRAGQAVYPANYNSPKQLVIGGSTAGVDQAIEEIQEAKLGKRALKLRVSGAFHTPFFNGARDKMRVRLQGVRFKQPAVPVISNTTGQAFAAAEISPTLERQLAVPTHFDECLRVLVEQKGADATLEIGPGKTLTSFAHQIDRQLNRQHISNLGDYEKFVEEALDGSQR